MPATAESRSAPAGKKPTTVEKKKFEHYLSQVCIYQ
jgi:hypothetical protein